MPQILSFIHKSQKNFIEEKIGELRKLAVDHTINEISIIMNVPPLFFLSLEKFNIITLIFSEFTIFIFIFLGGSENLILDTVNRFLARDYGHDGEGGLFTVHNCR